ncbi:hypothetical protein AB0887_08545, partial [Streptomyces huasconensis]
MARTRDTAGSATRLTSGDYIRPPAHTTASPPPPHPAVLAPTDSEPLLNSPTAQLEADQRWYERWPAPETQPAP